MIFVDSSVWIDFFRGNNPELAGRLKSILDKDEVLLAYPVRCEILAGCGKHDYRKLKMVLSALPLFYPSKKTWELVDASIAKAVEHNERFGFADLLIAVLAQEHGASLWTLDRDFERMAKLGLVELFQYGD